MAHEGTPLLEDGSSPSSSPWTATWSRSLRWLIFGSWINIFLLYVPLSAVAHNLGWNPGFRFSASLVAILPLAKLVGDTAKQLSLGLRPTPAALLNATVGNVVEIIVGLTALLQGQIQVVQASLLGSIISNILLVLGCSFVTGALADTTVGSQSAYRVTAAQTNASLMSLACITAIIPAAYNSFRIPQTSTPNGLSIVVCESHLGHYSEYSSAAKGGTNPKELHFISRGTALLLLGTYMAYLVFQLKTHRKLFGGTGTTEDPSSHRRDTGNSHVEDDLGENGQDESAEKPDMSLAAAALSLVIVIFMTCLVADYLVNSIEETAEKYSVPKQFIGFILLPIASNAGELFTSIAAAKRKDMALAIDTCIGSSIQTALFVIPFLVIVGWIIGSELTMFFEDFETVVFFVSVLMVNLVLQTGKSNYMDGLMLITLYLIISGSRALSVYLSSVAMRSHASPHISLGLAAVTSQDDAQHLSVLKGRNFGKHYNWMKS